ncbi:MAG: FAD-dependent oxidoreductase [Planctomycetes bacterium]|nr:FAD-dependent oxidoreductase [Planctomycetota bacterium]MCB9871876.1 FAD-dependent oxidoreductase [Planctomycetota bacterium]
MTKKRVVILGGGLAGLSCGYELSRAGHEIVVLEREPHVGGMASSFIEDGEEYWTHDFGPHRFHSSDENLIEHVKEILGDNLVWAERLSRIVLFNKFFDYPLSAKNVLKNMPPLLLVRAFLDYFAVRFQDRLGLKKFDDKSFESWVTRRFGKTLYRIFFGQYTEKAWGMPPSQISADWASQRISLLSLADTVKKTLFPGKGGTPRTLVRKFIYPKFGGIGELARGYARKIEENGGQILVNSPAVRVHHDDAMHVTGIEYGRHRRETITGDEYINTIPITSLVKALSPAAPAEVLAHVNALQYISIVFVYLKLRRETVSPDSWVYLPEKHLTVHRISEFRNFSKTCAPQGKTMVCAEITCRRGDEIWRMNPEDLEKLAEKDLMSVGLIGPGEIEGSFIKRIPYAYPVYDLEYRGHLAPIQQYLAKLGGIVTTGRQGNFRYNNMDQSVEMGRKVADEILTGDRTGHEAVATGKEYFG